MSTLSNSTNIFWQESPVGKLDRQKLLNQKGCVVWITGLSGSGLLFLIEFHSTSNLRRKVPWCLYVHKKFVVFSRYDVYTLFLLLGHWVWNFCLFSYCLAYKLGLHLLLVAIEPLWFCITFGLILWLFPD